MKSLKKPLCPKCGSSELSLARHSPKAFAISFLLLGFPLPFTKKTFLCYDCRHTFKHPK